MGYSLVSLTMTATGLSVLPNKIGNIVGNLRFLLLWITRAPPIRERAFAAVLATATALVTFGVFQDIYQRKLMCIEHKHKCR